ncbi:hypothetical protein Tco_0697178 [Tanacetum coccineum]
MLAITNINISSPCFESTYKQIRKKYSVEATVFPDQPEPFQKGSALRYRRDPVPGEENLIDKFLEISARGGEVKGVGVAFGVARSSLGEKPGGVIGVGGGESRGVEGAVLRSDLFSFFSLEDFGIVMINVWLEIGDGDAMEKMGKQSEYEFLKYTSCKRIITARDVILMGLAFV